GDELRGRKRTREGRALPGPLGTEAEVADRLGRGVERLSGVVGDRVRGHVAVGDAGAEGGEAVRETPRRAAGDGAGHDGVVRGVAEEGDAIAGVGLRLGA